MPRASCPVRLAPAKRNSQLPRLPPVRLDDDDQPIMYDEQWGNVKIRHFANIERAGVMG